MLRSGAGDVVMLLLLELQARLSIRSRSARMRAGSLTRALPGHGICRGAGW